MFSDKLVTHKIKKAHQWGEPLSKPFSATLYLSSAPSSLLTASTG